MWWLSNRKAALDASGLGENVPNAMTAPAVDIVIVSYRGRELLRRCLTSLAENPAPGGATMTVVDNASDDGTPAMVASEFADVRLIAESSNLGFARASNIGIRAGAAPLVLILNPDAAIDAETLTILYSTLESNPRIGCIGPELIRDDGSLDHAGRRSFPTPLSALGHFSGIGTRLRGGRLAAYRAPDVDRGPVDAVNGAFMLMRREALAEVGLFDEGYWMYMEDLDLNYRLAEGGWTTFYESRARAFHTKAGTTGGHRDARLNIAFHKGMGRFYRAHYAEANSGLLNLAVYAGIGLKLAASLLAGAAAAGISRERRGGGGAPAGGGG